MMRFTISINGDEWMVDYNPTRSFGFVWAATKKGESYARVASDSAERVLVLLVDELRIDK